MSEFVAEVHRRTREAQNSLDAARAEGDDYLVAVREGELDELNRLAADNEVIALDEVPREAPPDGMSIDEIRPVAGAS